MNVQSQVSLWALHQTTARNPALIRLLYGASGPCISANLTMARNVRMARGMAKSDAYSMPSSIEMRAISTIASVNMAKMKVSRAPYWP